MFQAQLVFSLAQPWDWPFPQGALVLFMGEMAVRGQDVVVSAYGSCCVIALRPSRWWCQDMCMCMCIIHDTRVCTEMYNYFHICVCVCVCILITLIPAV